MRRTQSLIALLTLCAGTCTAMGQDSVAAAPGGNDALSAYDASSQRVRYIVDAVPATTSWGNAILIAPLAKASRDTDPLFRTQILGSIAASPSLLLNTSFSSQPYALWTTPGAGIHPTDNSAPGSINAAGFASQFAIALSDFSLNPTNATVATVGRISGSFNRLYVERVAAVSSRSSIAGADTATLSLGGVDATGNLALRADNFNTLPATANRVLGDNIIRVSLASRGGSVNTLFASGGINGSTDAAATTYVVSNETNPTNTPTVVNQPGTGPFALIYDFAGRFRTGSSTGNLITGATHLPAGVNGHRGNPAFTPLAPFGGTAGSVASIAFPNSGSLANRLMAFGVNFGSAGSAPTVAPGTQRSYTIPVPISSPDGFTANSSGTASFKQYLSQTSFRGGNGQVGVGTDSAGNMVLAVTATDAATGDFIAVAKANSGGTAAWTVAGHAGQSVLSGETGSPIGVLSGSGVTFSSPAVDKFGNVYFVATWTPNLAPAAAGLFKAVNASSGYKLELLLTTGQTIAGANSGRTFTVSSLALADSDSIASGAMFSQAIIQDRDPAAKSTTATKIRAFGGLIVSAVLTYDNGGTPETYDAVLYVGPGAGVDCPADFNGVGGVSVQDIFDFLAAWFAGNSAADFNSSGAVTVQDIFDFLAAWFAGCN